MQDVKFNPVGIVDEFNVITKETHPRGAILINLQKLYDSTTVHIPVLGITKPGRYQKKGHSIQHNTIEER
jgi:hypothetical protein